MFKEKTIPKCIDFMDKNDAITLKEFESMSENKRFAIILEAEELLVEISDIKTAKQALGDMFREDMFNIMIGYLEQEIKKQKIVIYLNEIENEPHSPFTSTKYYDRSGDAFYIANLDNINLIIDKKRKEYKSDN